MSTPRKDGRTKNGIRISEIAGRRREYEVDFQLTVGGKRVRVRRHSPFGSVGETQVWAEQEREAILKRGRVAQAEPPRVDPEAPRTFKYWADRWLADAEHPARAKGRNRPGTLDSKRSIVSRHLVPILGRRPITDIDDEVVEAYIKTKVDEGMAETTIGLHLMKLRAVVRLAARRGSEVERQRVQVPSVRIAGAGSKIPATLSEAQTEKMLSALAGDIAVFAFAAVLWRQGMRVGEVIALRRGDIELDRDLVHVRRTWTRHGFELPKGGRVRVIPLHWQARLALVQLLEVQPDDEPWRLVFQSPRTNGPPQPKWMMRLVCDRLEDLGVEFRDEDGELIDLTSKLGRHSLGRHWAERGLPLQGLQDVLGHADLTTTQVYAHWSPRATAPLLQQIGRDQRAVEREAIASRLRDLGVDELTLRAAGLTPSR